MAHVRTGLHVLRKQHVIVFPSLTQLPPDMLCNFLHRKLRRCRNGHTIGDYRLQGVLIPRSRRFPARLRRGDSSRDSRGFERIGLALGHPDCLCHPNGWAEAGDMARTPSQAGPMWLARFIEEVVSVSWSAVPIPDGNSTGE